MSTPSSATHFRLVRLELAREPAHPAGDPSHSYRLVLPLTGDGRIDAAAWKADPDRCHVVREDPEGEKIGRLEHGPGDVWAFRYPSDGRDLGFRFAEERFVPGEYVALRRDDGEHTYRVVSQQPA